MKNNHVEQQKVHEQSAYLEASKNTSGEAELVKSYRTTNLPNKNHLKKNSFGVGEGRLNKLELAIALDIREQYQAYKVKLDSNKEKQPKR